MGPSVVDADAVLASRPSGDYFWNHIDLNLCEVLTYQSVIATLRTDPYQTRDNSSPESMFGRGSLSRSDTTLMEYRLRGKT